VLKWVRKKGTFVDVEANVGKYALTIARDYNSKSVRIIAIEAQPENYKALCRNVQLNKDFRNDLNIPIHKAASDHKGKVF
jgi:FkbM family methyltransferase